MKTICGCLYNWKHSSPISSYGSPKISATLVVSLSNISDAFISLAKSCAKNTGENHEKRQRFYVKSWIKGRKDKGYEEGKKKEKKREVIKEIKEMKRG